jgi:hypothetical protein
VDLFTPHYPAHAASRAKIGFRFYVVGIPCGRRSSAPHPRVIKEFPVIHEYPGHWAHDIVAESRVNALVRLGFTQRHGTRPEQPGSSLGSWPVELARAIELGPVPRGRFYHVRRAKKGDHLGQREAAAPMFSGVFDCLRQPGDTSSRDGLSVICQSESTGRSSASEAPHKAEHLGIVVRQARILVARIPPSIISRSSQPN